MGRIQQLDAAAQTSEVPETPEPPPNTDDVASEPAKSTEAPTAGSESEADKLF